MTLEEVIEHFGSASSACRAIGLCVQNSTLWKKKERIPFVTQVKIEHITNGKLKANMELVHSNKQSSKSLMPLKKDLILELEELRAFKKAHEQGMVANE